MPPLSPEQASHPDVVAVPDGIAIDLTDEELELARELGAEFTVKPSREDTIAAAL